MFVVGNGMSKFHKPKKDPSEGPHFHQLAKVAVTRALQDATISPDLIEQAVVGCTSAPVGQRALYDMGMFNIPICTRLSSSLSFVFPILLKKLLFVQTTSRTPAPPAPMPSSSPASSSRAD